MAQLFTTLKINEFSKSYSKRFRGIPKQIPESAKEAFKRPAYTIAKYKKEETEEEERDEWEKDTLQNLGMDERDFY